MKILCINTPCYGENWHLSGNSGCRWPSVSPGTIDKRPLEKQKDHYYAVFPFPLAYAASIFNQEGHEAKVIDFLALNNTYKEMYETIKNEAPERVLMEISAATYEQDLIIARNLSEFFGCEVWVCGPIVRAKEEELRGKDFLGRVMTGNYLKELFGGVDDYGSKLPAPYRDDTVLMYNDYFSFNKFIKKPQLQVWTSVGCPYGCTFCLWRWTLTDGKYQRIPYDRLEAEIRYAVDRWGFKSILFDDDTFNVGDEHVKTISKMMKNKFPDIQWSAMVRADSCSLKAFEIMRDSGCVGLKVGVETFSQSSLKKIGKGLDSEDLLKRILALHNLGFFVYLSTMQKIYGESPAEQEYTHVILKELFNLGIRYQRPACVPMVGTKLYDEYKKDGYKMDEIELMEYAKFNSSIITRIVDDRWKKGMK